MAQLHFVTDPTSGEAGAPMTVRVAIEDDYGHLVTAGTPSVVLRVRLTDGTEIANVATATAAAGYASFSDLRVERAGERLVLVAEAEGLRAGVSAPFDQTPGAAVRLAVVMHPASGRVGALGAVQVAVTDAFGNVRADASATITAALAANSAPLTGVTAVAAERGVATFAALTIGRAGAGYVLAFSSPGLVGAESQPFSLEAGAAAALVFLVEPKDGGASLPLAPAIEVAVADAYGNPLGSGEDLIHVSAIGEAALHGTTAIVAADGVASFGDLSLDRGGLDYRLLAWTDALRPAVSAPFKVLAAPSPVTAQSAFSDRVALSWPAVLGATSYDVYRDGALIGSQAMTSYADLAASPPSVPTAPTGLAASDGGDPALVHLTWSSALSGTSGPVHAYTVVAKDGATHSGASVPAEGRTIPAPISSYEVWTGAGWQDVGLVNAFDDAQAPPGTIAAGTTVATKRGFAGKVALSLSPPAAVVSPTIVAYEVRAKNAIGAGPASASDDGHRAVGAPQYQWRIFRDQNDPLPLGPTGATAASYDDLTAPANGMLRWYSCRVFATSATTADSAPDFGARKSASGVRDELWVVNATVNAVLPTAGAVYLGGDFTHVGPLTGGFVSVDATTAAVTDTWLRVDGAVNAIVPDGAGGSYLGGTFSTVGGVARNRLAHVLANGDVDAAFNPGSDGPVNALVLRSAVLYVGGAFGVVAGTGRNNVAAIDAVTGAATSWNPGTDGAVRALATAGTAIYLGGTFATVASTSRSRAAAVDVGGVLTAWHPNATGSAVNAIVASGSLVYVGGSFSNIGGAARNGVAALDATTGTANAWNPSATGTVNAIALSGNTAYVGGTFSFIGGASRSNLAAIDVACFAGTCALAWDPSSNAAVNALAVAGNTVYVGGAFSIVGSQSRASLAAIDQSGFATAWNAAAGDAVNALAVDGGDVLVGGAFRSVGGQARRNLAALDPTTGVALAFNPSPNQAVGAVAASGGTVYVGGTFASIGGAARASIAAVDASSGLVSAWQPGASSQVNAIAVAATSIFAGGTFLSFGGSGRSRLGAASAAGALLGWDPSVNGAVNALLASGTTIYAGGVFASFAGPTTRNNLAAIDASSAAILPWDPNLDGGVNAIAASAGLVYAGGAFTHVNGGATRNHAAAFDGAGSAAAWDPDVDGVVNALAIGASVYLGGSFATVSGAGRQNVAALALGPADPSVTAWNPGANGAVRALATSGAGVYVGGSFTSIDATARPGFAGFEP